MEEIRQNKNTLAIILVIFSMIFYGISFPATRVALKDYNPVSIITLRLLISSVILMILNISMYKRSAVPLKRDFPIFLLIAVFQPFLYFLFETYGLTSVSAAVSSLIIATIPVFTPLISRFFIREKLTVFNFIGLIFSFTGVILLVAFSDSKITGKNFTVAGLVLLFGAVLAAVFYTIIVKKLPHTYSALTITAVQNTLGLFLFLPVFFVVDFKDFITVVPKMDKIVSIVFLAIFASSLAFIFLNFGIKKLGPSKANGFVNLVPVVTAIVSFLFFKEHFTVYKILGMVVVLLGVLTAQKKRKSSKTS